MQHAEPTHGPALQGAELREVFAALAGVGERVAAEPEALEGCLREMVRGLREGLDLRFLALEAAVPASPSDEPFSCAEGEAGADDARLVQFPVMRGKVRVGAFSALPEGSGRIGEAREGALRSAAAVV